MPASPMATSTLSAGKPSVASNGIHILRAPYTATAAEREQLAALDKYQRRYLSRRVCALCEHRLDHVGCGACLGPPCDEATRVFRRAQCLKQYKPRLNRRRE